MGDLRAAQEKKRKKKNRMNENENIWRSEKLLKFDNIRHGTATRAYGRLSIQKGITKEAISNRNRLAEDGCFALQSITMVKQTHSNLVHVIEDCDMGNAVCTPRDQLPDGDAMVTNKRNVTLVIKTNDCVPILLYDFKKNIISAAHAGWKGVVNNIARNAIDAMNSYYHSDPLDIIAVLGPSIKRCHYDITNSSDDRIEQFKKAFSELPNVIIENEGSIFVDLANGVENQLTECGLRKTNIDIFQGCTFEMHDKFPSRRANGNKPTGLSTWTFIAIAE